MFVAELCDHAGNCRHFGPFSSDISARDWGMEAQELGFLPRTTFSVRPVEAPLGVEEPIDLGFVSGL